MSINKRDSIILLFPIVSLFDENGKMQHLAYAVTICDWCGKRLTSEFFEMDNSIRPMYFCCEKCKSEFNSKYPIHTNSYPNIKLSVKGLTTPLKFYNQNKPLVK